MLKRWLLPGVVTVVVAMTGSYFYFLPPDSIAAALAAGQYRQAIRLLQKPSLESNAGAQATLGNMHYLGLGTGQNFTESALYYSRAAFAGSTAAQVNLGHLYSSGLGVEQNTQLAYAWFNLAKNNGSRVAQDYMSEMLREHRLNFRVVEQLQVDYATISQFSKIHLEPPR